MEGFGNIISEILTQINHDIFKESKGLKENLIAVLKNERKANKNVIPRSRIRLRTQMIDLLDNIIDILNSKLTDNEKKLLADTEKGQKSSLSCKVSQSSNRGKKKFFSVHLKDILYIPRQPKPSFPQIISKLYGTPSDLLLREEGHFKGKRTKPELDHDFRNKIIFVIAPLMDKLREDKKIDNNEFEQIKDLMTFLQNAYFIFCKNNREITKKDTIRCFDALDKAGFKFIPSTKAEVILEYTEPYTAICEICFKPFKMDRNSRKYCNECSNSPEYQRLRRKGLHKK